MRYSKRLIFLKGIDHLYRNLTLHFSSSVPAQGWCDLGGLVQGRFTLPAASGKVTPMSKLSLDRILQSQGFGTRKYCRSLIEDGDVVIDGVTQTNYRTTVETDGLVLHVFEEEWVYRAHLYLALNKPANFECSRKPSHHPGVLTLLPEQFTWREVQPVGRLDHDTTGMLLMSDDGPFIHAQSSPKRHVPKIYQATTQEPVTDELVALLLAGVQLHDEPAPLAALVCVKRGEYQLEIVLEQGKYHQVKRMLAAAGNHCSALHRSAIGSLTLESLGIAEGEWCYLTPEQIALLA
ncbi:ribosomal small subunit pseudouridine synthase A [Janthinobacterium sp. HH103]|nr:ribosomal small subunit pseudouridine synthase A [Janthinobacterium sp. HH100]OEZ79673.1 ribosomal small subunit pseudouridine synthase A [Janthinobacterium sp. HH103]QOU75207.1 RNA pseudouridylate synthase [Janthinobacterium sp. HH102]